MLDYKRAKDSSSPRFSNQQPTPESGFSSGLPNSALLPAAAPADSGLGERMRFRLSALLGQNPAAEAEADRLSKGVQASTPEEVKSEMGRRLGADLSGVRLHTGGAEAERADHMGANAFTVGRDVYFGSGGFRADTAAHEMVHTVQQGAVDGGVSVFVPMGSVQMQPKFDDDMKNFKVWAKKYKFRKLGKEIDELNKLASNFSKDAQEAEARWNILRKEIMDKINECCDGAGAEDSWVKELQNVLRQLEQVSKPTIIDANTKAFQEWVDKDMKGKEEEFDKDDYFRENDIVFASVSQVEDKEKSMKDVVGSIYFGNNQGLQGGRLRLFHKSGPEISLYDHMFRYLSKNQPLPEELKEQPKLMEQLETLWPELMDHPEQLRLLIELGKQGKLKELATKKYSEQLDLLSDPRLQETLPLLKEEGSKNELLTQLNKGKQKGLTEILTQLQASFVFASKKGFELIDYTKLNKADDKGSKNLRVVEYMKKHKRTATNHKSRGHAETVGAVTQLGKDGKESLIQAVRYAMKLKEDFITEEKNKLDKSYGEQMNLIKQQAAMRANHFLYAFMRQHEELKHIPIDEVAYAPNSEYYEETSGGKKEEEKIKEEPPKEQGEKIPTMIKEAEAGKEMIGEEPPKEQREEIPTIIKEAEEKK